MIISVAFTTMVVLYLIDEKTLVTSRRRNSSSLVRNSVRERNSEEAQKNRSSCVCARREFESEKDSKSRYCAVAQQNSSSLRSGVSGWRRFYSNQPHEGAKKTLLGPLSSDNDRITGILRERAERFWGHRNDNVLEKSTVYSKADNFQLAYLLRTCRLVFEKYFAVSTFEKTTGQNSFGVQETRRGFGREVDCSFFQTSAGTCASNEAPKSSNGKRVTYTQSLEHSVSL